jgi:hypothetical protein
VHALRTLDGVPVVKHAVFPRVDVGENTSDLRQSVSPSEEMLDSLRWIDEQMARPEVQSELFEGWGNSRTGWTSNANGKTSDGSVAHSRHEGKVEGQAFEAPIRASCMQIFCFMSLEVHNEGIQREKSIVATRQGTLTAPCRRSVQNRASLSYATGMGSLDMSPQRI